MKTTMKKVSQYQAKKTTGYGRSREQYQAEQASKQMWAEGHGVSYNKFGAASSSDPRAAEALERNNRRETLEAELAAIKVQEMEDKMKSLMLRIGDGMVQMDVVMDACDVWYAERDELYNNWLGTHIASIGWRDQVPPIDEEEDEVDEYDLLTEDEYVETMGQWWDGYYYNNDDTEEGMILDGTEVLMDEILRELTEIMVKMNENENLVREYNEFFSRTEEETDSILVGV